MTSSAAKIDLPPALVEYICHRMRDECRPAYFQLDPEGVIRDWGGPLEHYGLDEPAIGESMARRYDFMAGLLPLDREFVRMPCVQIGSGAIVDLHLVGGDDRIWVLLMDASGKVAGITLLKQKINEMALDGSLPGETPPDTEPAILADLLEALDIAGLLWTGQERFRLLGKAPGWLIRLWPGIAEQPADLIPAEAFPFLANFLLDARQFWEGGSGGRLESGVWSETDPLGREYLLEAAAVRAGEARVLVIEYERGLARERRNVLQKGRNLALDYHFLNRMEKELERSRDDLEQRVRERTRELELANRRLANELEARARVEKERAMMNIQLQQAQKMEAIGTLASGIAHDFNNILSAVIGFTEIALYDVAPGSALKNNLEQVLRAGCRARDLVKQILTFSRQTEPEKKPVQLKLVAAEALRFIRASLPSTIAIDSRLRSDSLVMADPTQLHQVIMNLATNAGHAMAESGGTLRVGLSDCVLDPGRARLLQVSPGSFVCLEVADTGCGMPPDVMARIFDPFFTTKQKDQGTGMGLSVVHGIVKGCGGGIQVESTPAKGTVFRAYFPAMKTAEQTMDRQVRDLATGSERILVIDDEKFQVDIMRQVLARLGYRVATATDSQQALDLFVSDPYGFDLVITDMTMPGFTGLQLARRILAIRQDIPVILCSGFGESMIRKSAQGPAIAACLMKPVVMDQLASTVRRVLDDAGRAG